MKRRSTLSEGDLQANPVDQLKQWLQAAEEEEFVEPTAMVLATATPDGRPSARVLLLKGLDDAGLVFYTNVESRKGTELLSNPRAAAVFYWDTLARQVRVEGSIERLSAEESFSYFQTRPRMSQLGAWASNQSRVIADRTVLDEALETIRLRYAGEEIPLPPFWRGFRLVPIEFEFWQGRENRLHDRLCYSRRDHRWVIERLSP